MADVTRAAAAHLAALRELREEARTRWRVLSEAAQSAEADFYRLDTQVQVAMGELYG